MTLFWLLAIIITLSAAVYQRITGPTHPKKVELNINNSTYNLKLTRSHGGDNDCPVIFVIPDTAISATVTYKRFPTNDNWKTVNLTRKNDTLQAFLPHQPPAGKIEYKVSFYKNNKLINTPDNFHVVVRFKGGVPGFIIIPHVILMFIAMLISNLAGILAVAKHKKMVFYTNLTLTLLLIGGMIFGPLMQLYAFGELWTGFPKGMDLTDNKTLIAVIFWIIAFFANRKKQRPVWIIIASIVMLMIYLIPHSMFGSEFNYEAGKVVTG
jgi:hypothetical protein